MRKLFMFAAVAMLCCSSAIAQIPVARITGPTGGVAGDLIVLSADDSDATQFAWSVIPELPDGRVTILPIENNRRCIVTSVPGTWHVFLAIGSDAGVAILRHTIVISGDSPIAPVIPRPIEPKPVDPKPTLPEFAALVATWDAPSVKRAELAAAFDGVAAKASAGVYSDVQAMTSASTAANREVLQNDIAAWQTWFAKLSQALQNLAAEGKLRSIDDHANAWRDIARGLRRE